MPQPTDHVRYLGGWATRAFRDEELAKEKKERDEERLRKFREQIMERSARKTPW